MVIIITRQKFQSMLHTDTFASNENLLVCFANEKNSAVIMGLEQYFRVRERQGKGGEVQGSKTVKQ